MNNQNLPKLKIWFMAVRPKTLPAAVGPVIIGSSFAIDADEFQFLPASAALIGALLLQIAANLANDYFDFIKGTDTEDRIGPIRVASSGLLDIAELKNGLVLVIFLALIDGLYLIYIAGWPILLIGGSAIIFLLVYSGGPLPFGYRGLGDFIVFLYFGIIAVSDTYYVQALIIDRLVLIG
jgi:1,4-dihydroxy-2-naphthoate octaprenyltransferase